MNSQSSPQSHLNFGAIMVGTVFALILNVCFTLIGGMVGLAAYTVEGDGDPSLGLWLGVIAFTLVSAVVVFATSGYVAARLASTQRKWEAIVHGLATFAFATAIVISTVGSVAITHVVVGDLRRGTTMAGVGALLVLAISALASAWGARRGMRAASKNLVIVGREREEEIVLNAA